MFNKGNRANVRTFGIVIAVLVSMLILISTYGNRYNRQATVTGIRNGIVTCQDLAGESWAFRGDDFYIGQKIVLRMSMNGTQNDIRDDIILGVK